MDRKYKQRGYSDRDSQEKKRERSERPSGEPRPKQDSMGPRTPRMVGTVMRARCSSCGAVLMPGFDPNGDCLAATPRCTAANNACILIRVSSSSALSRFPNASPKKTPRTIARSLNFA